IALEVDRLRFYFGGAPVPESEDLIARLENMVQGLVERRDEQERERQAEREERLRAERERDEALRKLAELEQELRKLRGE
ncbi:MAG: Uma2 family endonuclease, partial [Polyangiaceae bacterium]|nr:Uma2 family endonuclease [Polyangiaceae bacterium]